MSGEVPNDSAAELAVDIRPEWLKSCPEEIEEVDSSLLIAGIRLEEEGDVF